MKVKKIKTAYYSRAKTRKLTQMRKYFGYFFLVYLSMFTKNAYSNEQVCLAKNAQSTILSCCINTAEFTVIDNNSTACSCSVKWSEPKKLCQCPNGSFFIAGKCRTAKEVIALDAYQQQVRLMKVPIYVSFLAKESKKLQSKTLTVNIDGKGLTTNISKIRFSYQLNPNNQLSVTFYSPIFKQDNGFIRTLLSNHIAAFYGLKFDGCLPLTDEVSSDKSRNITGWVKVASIALKVQPSPTIKTYLIEDLQSVLSLINQSENDEHSLCVHLYNLTGLE